MSFPLAIFLGVVQGLTEFLPVSSSGHLVLLQKIFKVSKPPIFFTVLVHLGTLLAVLLFFRGELSREFRKLKVLKRIAVGTLPVVVVGLLIHPFLKIIFGNLFLVGGGFLATSIILWGSKKFLGGKKDLGELTNLQALLVGLFQAAAILPGVSRSGTTIVGGLSQKLSYESSFRFSFYLSLPAIVGALILELQNLSTISFLSQSFWGMITAFVSGYLALNFLKKVLTAQKLYYFSFYCFLLGIISLLTSLNFSF